MKQLLENNSLILMEAAIVEPLRRSDDISLHPVLVNAPLIYEEAGRKALCRLYQKYIDIALEAKKPFLMCTPTWRTNQTRVAETKINKAINIDAAHFLQGLRKAQGAGKQNIRIGGMIGCKNDCYKPEEALSASQAEQFHAWQIGQLKQGGVDFIIAETLPNVEEAIGIARAIEHTGQPYFISFVISRDGVVLDGTDLNTAIHMVDANTSQKPLGFMVNCTYPSFLCAASQPPELFERLIGYMANASSLDHCDLDDAEELLMENVSDWGDLMLELNRTYGLKVLGGCCGTNEEHLRYIVSETPAGI
jgi:S-methylmethionine-dependent homocysteine/selenocysteine methylase